jgi:hypothetical protein
MPRQFKKNSNKRRERTEQLETLLIQRDINELADNTIEQSRFDCLVHRGIIVTEPQEA